MTVHTAISLRACVSLSRSVLAGRFVAMWTSFHITILAHSFSHSPESMEDRDKFVLLYRTPGGRSKYWPDCIRSDSILQVKFLFSLAPPTTVRAASTTVRDGRAGVVPVGSLTRIFFKQQSTLRMQRNLLKIFASFAVFEVSLLPQVDSPELGLQEISLMVPAEDLMARGPH